ncbi:hypothetical protein PUMCH_004375 [Australozyma saopauloensis]|uniref:Zn(2)-C6 fungal-type domain-containing protein n=1 Tax=Australozyma saopauloensis TaxID=291208 RepID=A0AAX4HF69_9ASCO|nr:hypothetical protein PUMCH_004375 [[Candida] saopauloensis]
MSEDIQPRYKRSEYLKNGCRECKRRKIKCDEFVNPPREAFSVMNHQGKPLCWNCTRLKKICEYPRKGERVARVSRKYIMESEKNGNSPQPSISPISSSNSPFDPRNTSAYSFNPYIVHDEHRVPVASYLNSTTTSDNSSMSSNSHLNHQLSYQNYLIASQGGPQYPYNNYPRSSFSSLHFGTQSIPPNNMPAMSWPLNLHLGLDNTYNTQVSNSHDFQNSQPPEAKDSLHQSPVSAGSSGVNLPPVQEPTTIEGMHKFGSKNPPFLNNTEKYQIGSSHENHHIPHILNDSSSLISTQSHINAPQTSIGAKTYEPSDLTVIASDLNNLVSDMIFEINDSKSNPLGAANILHESPTDISDSLSLFNNMFASNSIPKNVSLKAIPLLRPREQQYLEEFFDGFSAYILPFPAYEPNLKIDYNPIRDILLTCAAKEPVLLAAILSQSARISFAKSGSPNDEEAYYQYLLKCLKILGPALKEAGDKDEDELISSIEGILLTVLLLTSANAAHFKQNWRPHLRGAKDILLKKSRILKRSESQVLVFCKLWFCSFEILAGLSLKIGGTLQDQEEMNLLLNFESTYEIQVLKDLGLVLENGFSLLAGFHNDVTPALRDLNKLLVKSRGVAKQPLDDTQEYIRLLAALENLSQIEFVNSRCILNSSDFPNGVVPNGLLLEELPGRNVFNVISWMDLSHKLYILAAKTVLLREFLGLSYDSPQIQALAHQFASWFSHLTLSIDSMSEKYKLNIIMIQWPIQVFGMILIRPGDRQLVSRLYQYTEKAGAGGASHIMNRLKRLWHNYDSGVADCSDDDVDVVNY